MFQSEPICILTAGPTVDGRLIEQQVIDDIAEFYDPKTYNARINEEHWSWGAKYGSVLSVEKRENQLFAVLKPNALFLSMIEQGQLLHTSCEITHDFAKSGKSYLTGLALTDEPASLGTTEIHLSAKDKGKNKDEKKESLSSGSTIGKGEFSVPEQQNEQEDRKLFARIKHMFSSSAEQTIQTEEENEAMDKETKALFSKQAEQLTSLTSAVTALTAVLTPEKPEEPVTPEAPIDTELSTKFEELSTKFDGLLEKLSTTTDEEKRRLAGEGAEDGYL